MVRPATRLGAPTPEPFLLPTTEANVDPALGARRARAAALLQLALPGSAYTYQGEERGLPEVMDLADDERDDPTFRRTDGAMLGRDGCRVPIPWTGDASPFGFSPSGSSPPWLPMPDSWREHTLEAQLADPSSMLNLYRSAIANRPKGVGLTWCPAPDTVLAFRRGATFQNVTNLGPDPVPLPPADVVLTSSPLASDGSLPPDTTAWLMQNRLDSMLADDGSRTRSPGAESAAEAHASDPNEGTSRR